MQDYKSRQKIGEMAEWSIAAVLKTVKVRDSGGSNPSLSAKHINPQGVSIAKAMLILFSSHAV